MVTCPGSRTDREDAFIRNVLVQAAIYFPTATKRSGSDPFMYHGTSVIDNHPASPDHQEREMNMKINGYDTNCEDGVQQALQVV